MTSVRSRGWVTCCPPSYQQGQRGTLRTDEPQKTHVELMNSDPPATCDPEVVEVIEQACKTAGLSNHRMISRAYHDSLFLSLVAPTSMIFIPCRDGISHRPDEYASPVAIGAGCEALALTLARLSEAT